MAIGRCRQVLFFPSSHIDDSGIILKELNCKLFRIFPNYEADLGPRLLVLNSG